LQRDLKIALGIGGVLTIFGIIVEQSWDQISRIFQNVLLFQNLTINQSQAYFGIILFAGTILSGYFLIRFLFNIFKKKPIATPPTGIQYKQISCPYCNYPNIVFPPTEDYKRVVFFECTDKQGRNDHNVPRQVKCHDCGKKFDYFWCSGHTFVVSKR
jgi:DNA-directed RNA polymerase subunit RPC12/RpoP